MALFKKAPKEPEKKVDRLKLAANKADLMVKLGEIEKVYLKVNDRSSSQDLYDAVKEAFPLFDGAVLIAKEMDADDIIKQLSNAKSEMYNAQVGAQPDTATRLMYSFDSFQEAKDALVRGLGQ